MKNEEYLLALQSVDGLGPIRLKNLLDFFESDARLAWLAKENDLKQAGIPKDALENLVGKRRNFDPQKYAEDIKKSGIKWLTIYDEKYPKRLKGIYDPPLILFYLGDILPVDERAFAIVGTRKMTGYGKIVTEKFTKYLSEAGLTIVSGLARGVDTCAHKTTIDAGGRTLAILGGGLRKIFPPENIKLAEKIADGMGAVITEFAPDDLSMPGNFPARNRIISGLSLAVLVTEAAEDSGSLITAKEALEQGREVFAIPGPITSDLSKGPSSLIKQGARLVTEPEEVLEELGLEKVKSLKEKVKNDLKLTEVEKKILENLENESKHIDEICRELKLSAAEVSAALIKMEIFCLVKNLGGGNYLKVC